MSQFGEPPPFHEFEERYLLAEILKNSLLPPAVILQFIRDTNVQPAWYNITIPFGRSLAQCQNAYAALSQRTYESPPAFTLPPRKLKRPLSGEPAVPTERILQPRPVVTFASVNGPGQISPVFDDGKPRKKRGRPSKEEHDRRVAEAEARGEIYPKPRKPKTPRPSMEGQGVETVEVVGGGVPTAVMFAPNQSILATPISPTKASDTVITEESAIPAGQISHEEQRAAESMTTGPHMEESDPKEDPLTGLRRHNVLMAEIRGLQMATSGVTASPGSDPAQATFGIAHGLQLPNYHMHRPLIPHLSPRQAPVQQAPIQQHQIHEPQLTETRTHEAQSTTEQTKKEQRHEGPVQQAQMQEARKVEEQRQQ